MSAELNIMLSDKTPLGPALALAMMLSCTQALPHVEYSGATSIMQSRSFEASKTA